MRSTNKKTGVTDSATFVITGSVTDVYDGRDADYASVKVMPDLDGYYDMYRVAVAKEVGVEVGDEITCTGTMTTFFDRVKKKQTINFNATSVKPAK